MTFSCQKHGAVTLDHPFENLGVVRDSGPSMYVIVPTSPRCSSSYFFSFPGKLLSFSALRS